ncbi:putative L-aspartate dehydrogenase [Azorhizobium oxalatiphilum]|uniref:L-aspartate dehydrogenase n=1 Tax=Azorhizobium oxalatiphilum TaxID=980631 RepID=A0A917BPG2_9HYPH|nr:aspartate dehydrogenase [Azorhizobium oxalatiphilum]GGF54138.1 putative L-aspartate dehydrogenase [Azorhizobium oxalatiphilum]
MKVGIIGYGAMGAAFRSVLEDEGGKVTAVLGRASSLARTRAELPTSVLVTDDVAAFCAAVDVAVECAGHEGLRLHGPRVLAAGIDLVVASVGALADAPTEAALRAAAETGGRLVIPAGALAGLDALSAARAAGLEEVRYTSRKAPRAWRGTKAETMIDLDAVTQATVFFEGSAREAALAFPQNANVVAAAALAGAGFEATRVALMADPQTSANRHQLEARGAFGELSLQVLARTLEANPKTSLLAPLSLVRAVLNLGRKVIV